MRKISAFAFLNKQTLNLCGLSIHSFVCYMKNPQFNFTHIKSLFEISQLFSDCFNSKFFIYLIHMKQIIQDLMQTMSINRLKNKILTDSQVFVNLINFITDCNNWLIIMNVVAVGSDYVIWVF